MQENAFENVVCEMVSILSQPQCVNHALDQYLPLTAPRFLNNDTLLACMMLKFHPCLEQSQKNST